MSLKSITSKLRKFGQRLTGKRNILRSRTLLSVGVIVASVTVVFAMTGVLYQRNEVFVTDKGETARFFTMLDEPNEILTELGYELGELDKTEFSGFVDDSAKITIYRSFNVSIADGAAITSAVMARGETVSDALEKAGFELGEFDAVEPAADTEVDSETSVKITRAYDVTLTADGSTRKIKALKNTVKELLDREGVMLDDNDLINLELDYIPSANEEIVVQRVDFVDRITVESIPYETDIAYSNLIAMGYSETTEGINGAKQITTREKYIDGKLISSTIKGSEITAEPVNEVITYGLALATPYSKRDFSEITLENGLPTDYKYIVSGKSCAYTAAADAGTASGRKLQIGTVAVDPNIIPYGSLLYIVTQDHSRVYGAAIAADTGSFTDVVTDLFMGTTDEHYDDACAWGARQVDIYVVNTGLY